MRARLKDDPPRGAIKIDFLYPALVAYRLAKDKPVEIPLDETQISSLLNDPTVAGELLAELLAMKIATDPEDKISQPFRETDANVKLLLPTVAKTIEYYNTLAAILKKRALSTNRLTTAVIRELIVNPSPDSIVNPKQVLADLASIEIKFNVTADQLFHALDTWYKPVAGRPIFSPSKASFYLPSSGYIVEAAERLNNRFAHDLVTAATEYVATANPSDWRHALTHVGESLANLTFVMLETKLLGEMPANAAEPMRETLLDIAQKHQSLPVNNDWDLF